eukprot:CAMPEP_0185174040 /NCGR_PEP_ID=MMETSP1139-20130426/24562_1 /TAXON_ID=298111 /ORGANISM="Pavlova sp., Strain CCMP459" /LENGTH=166 /DNA_ID=CAMNT_0027739747 /DNA_START=68 /DNA_END=568 /DNA_ORIENTATION=+
MSSSNSERDVLPIPCVQMARVHVLCTLDNIQEALHGEGGGEQLLRLDILLERLREICCRCARMQGDSYHLATTQFQGHIARGHVQRRLRHAVAPPSAEVVVTHARHASAEVCDHALALRAAGKQRQQGRSEEHGAHRVDSVDAVHPVRFARGDTSLGHCTGRAVLV